MAYATTVDSVDFSFDFGSSLIGIADPTAYVEATTIKEAAREAEASEEGIVYDHIVGASGRELFFVIGSDQIRNALTVVLRGSWLIDTALSSGYFIVSGGNVLQENQTPRIQIFADNPAVNTINNTTQFGTISRVAIGSGLSAEQDALLTETHERVGVMHQLGGFLAAAPAVLSNIGGGVWELASGILRQRITQVGEPTATGSTITHERDDP